MHTFAERSCLSVTMQQREETETREPYTLCLPTEGLLQPENHGNVPYSGISRDRFFGARSASHPSRSKMARLRGSTLGWLFLELVVVDVELWFKIDREGRHFNPTTFLVDVTPHCCQI